MRSQVEVQPYILYFLDFAHFIPERGSMPLYHRNTRRRGPQRKQNHPSSLTLLLIPALYLSTALTANAQPPAPFNPNLMKYACGPANRMFATLSPTSRFTDTT